MGSRTCDNCGNSKEVSGGKTCESGHFICHNCVTKDVGVFGSALKHCPLCKRSLK